MAINQFTTVFEARERKFQTEKIFQGEDLDLVARITNDGVPQDLTGYSVTGYYQPADYPGTDNASVFYSLTSEISQDKKSVIVHWTYDKDFGKTGYIVWALLSKGTEHVYPVAWKINLAHSPGYPPGETPEPIPQTLDFSQYDIVNDIWLRLTGGTVTGNVSITGNELVDGNLTVTGKFKSQDIKVNDNSVTQVWIGNNAGKAAGAVGGAVAIGYNAKTNPFGTAVGTGADVDTNGDVAVGFAANGTGNFGTALGRGTTATGDVSIAVGHNATASGGGSMAFGYGSNATATNAIQIGSYTDGTGTFPAYNHTANSVQIFHHQVFQTTGTPSSDPNTSNLVLVRERAPWAATLDSPSFTGTPTAPTATTGTNTTQVATTAFVQQEIAASGGGGGEENVIEVVKVNGTALTPDANKAVNVDLSTYAKLAGPTFTGTPKAPTASTGTNTTQIATTAFVNASITATVGTINATLDAINGEVI